MIYHFTKHITQIITLIILYVSTVTIGCFAMGKDVLIDSCERSMAKADYQRVRLLADKLMQRGKNDNSGRDKAFASAYLGADAVAIGEFEKGFKMLSSAKEWATKNQNDTVMALALNGLGIYYVMSENNMVVALKFLNEAHQYSRKAKTSMLSFRIDSNIIQIAIIRDDTTMLDYAIHSFDESAGLTVPVARSIMARHIARLQILSKDYDRALSYLNKADSLGDHNDNDRIVGDMLRAEINLRKGNNDLAAEYYVNALDKAVNMTQRCDAYLGLAKVALAKKEYKECIDLIHKVEAICSEADISAYNELCAELLMKGYAALGEWQKSYEYAEKYIQYLIVRNNIDNEYVQRQITTALQVEKKEQEAEMQRKELANMRQRTIFFAIAFIVVFILSIFLVREIRKKNRLYKTIVSQFKEAVAHYDVSNQKNWNASAAAPGITVEATEDKSVCNECKTDNATTECGREDDETEVEAIQLPKNMVDDLWAQLMQKVNVEEVYRDASLTRESLAKIIGTNRTYLSKIIYANTGMNFTQFINTYRINEAIRILSDKSKNEYPIKAVCHDIGFNSMTTFYKLFKERTHMTPSTFRKNS